MSKDELIKVLEKCEWAVVNNAMNDKFQCLLIPEEKWETVTTELSDRLEDGEDYKIEWEY